MSTMNEALQNVDYDQLNNWERGFYDDQKGKSYAPSPKQLAIINKINAKYTSPFSGIYSIETNNEVIIVNKTKNNFFLPVLSAIAPINGETIATITAEIAIAFDHI